MDPLPTAGRRLPSLDAFRGFTIAAMVLVNNPGDWQDVHAPLRHARWHGWTFTDLVFPFFLFIVGVAMVVSTSARLEGGAARTALLRTLARRALLLFAVGLALHLYPRFDLATVRVPGVLQRIAWCSLLAAPLVLWCRTVTLAGIATALLALHAALLLRVPVPDPGGVVIAGALEPGRDLGAWLDRQVFGSHVWQATRTWDPEGLLGTLGALATLLAGTLAGRALTLPAAVPARALGLLTAGVAALAVGSALDAVLTPINKNLWTPSYAVFTAGWALVAFGAFHLVLDGKAHAVVARAAAPLRTFGHNALIVYIVSALLARTLVTARVGDLTLGAWLYAPFRQLPLAPEDASLAWALLFVLAMYVLARGLELRGWFIRA